MKKANTHVFLNTSLAAFSSQSWMNSYHYINSHEILHEWEKKEEKNHQTPDQTTGIWNHNFPGLTNSGLKKTKA